MKATVVEVTDGIAMLGYAGLGATTSGSQPSDWVSNVLRGRHHPLEKMLRFVAEAMEREFIPHLEGFRDKRSRRHCFVVPAFLNDRPRLYTIDVVHDDEGYRFRYERQIMGGTPEPLQVTVPICLVGSGAVALKPFLGWKRPLMSLVKAYNLKKVSGETVAKRLAQMAYSSHLGTKDGSVGPDCLVVWRNAKGGLHKGGGEYSFFSNGEPTRGAAIPMIANGMDMTALVKIITAEIMPHFEKVHAALERGDGAPEFDVVWKEIDRHVSQLPSTPDEKLR